MFSPYPVCLRTFKQEKQTGCSGRNKERTEGTGSQCIASNPKAALAKTSKKAQTRRRRQRTKKTRRTTRTRMTTRTRKTTRTRTTTRTRRTTRRRTTTRTRGTRRRKRARKRRRIRKKGQEGEKGEKGEKKTKITMRRSLRRQAQGRGRPPETHAAQSEILGRRRSPFHPN